MKSGLPPRNSAPHEFVIAILGAGPAGCTLGALLAREGMRPVIFDDGKRPEMLVGESLIPAVVPLLRRLEIEDRVAAISQHKPGVSFLHDTAESIHFNFHPVAKVLPTYAYNVDRPLFDDLLKKRAEELGATLVCRRAGVGAAPLGSDRELLLDEASVAAVPEWKGRQPDLLVDCTGRARLFAKTLGLGSVRGKREDIAHFAHFTGCPMPEPAGQVQILRLNQGWAWKIPLRDKLSVGVVMNREAARQLGATAEERLTNALCGDPMLADIASARRVTPAATYTNYQLTSKKSYGRGWVLAGDAFGFVDPMLSSGLFLAMRGAEELASALAASNRGPGIGGPALSRSLECCDSGMRLWYARWTGLVDYFYDGRIFALNQAGRQMRGDHPGRIQHLLDRFISKHIALLTSGASTRSGISQWGLAQACRWLTRQVPPAAELAIR